MVPILQFRIGDGGMLTTSLIYPFPSYCVYYLRSQVSPKTYVGYSIDPFHRLDQHNHFIAGGAKKTLIGRPWTIVCIVSGFPTSRAALQFEWKWHHIRKKKLRYGKKVVPGLGMTDCFSALRYLFSCQWTSDSPSPGSFPLFVWWNHCNPCPNRILGSSLEYQYYSSLSGCKNWDVYQGYFY